ncbi:HAD family hydrolase [Haladaptatus sp. DFWS20]|uniref:HAD family hydrolase n=1 Tax=Haladaptatus sp. DFWS20 TaxID=3403467 RepID=UPI003EBBBCDC
MAVSFDLFGTLVEVTPPDDPAGAVANALEGRGVIVPSNWDEVYTTSHIETPTGRELSLVDHVTAGLNRRGDGPSKRVIRAALLDAFTTAVRTRAGAQTTVEDVAEHEPVGILSNCSVPGLVPEILARSAFEPDTFDAVVSSVECGWRKPDERAFREITNRLDAPLSELIHVGDTPETDGGATDAGATAILLASVPLSDVPSKLEESK